MDIEAINKKRRMSPLEWRAEEEISDYMMTHDCNRNPIVFSPASFKKGIEFFKDQPEVKELVKSFRDLVEHVGHEWCPVCDEDAVHCEMGKAKEALKAWSEFTNGSANV